MYKVIKQELSSIIHQLGIGQAEDVQISRTKNPEHGDYASNIAMVLAKSANQSPMKLAKQIQSMVNHPDITRVEVASPGFLNFFTSLDFTPLIEQILSQDAVFFSPNEGENKSIYLEYVSANPTGPLHVGHGRSAAYGSTLANILRRTQYDVHTEYYINDAGLQIHILTASLWLCLLQKEVPEGCYRGEYLVESASQAPQYDYQAPKDLDALLADFDKDRDTETLISLCKESLQAHYDILKTWITDHIVSGIKEDLTAFGVEYDAWFQESSLLKEDEVSKLIAHLKSKDYVYEKDNALWFKSSEYGDEKDRVLIRSNGMFTYFANDLGYHYHKCQTHPDLLINVFGSDHHGYVPRIKAGLKALDMEKHFQCILIQFAHLYRGEEKVPMSTRSGQFVTLKELYEEVSVDAARFFYCMRNSDNHLDFDLELAKSQNSQNPVYYIQYAHARICSIFEKQGEYTPMIAHHQQANDLEIELLEILSGYPELLRKMSRSCDVYRLTQYLLNLATKFHKYYNNSPVLCDDGDTRHHRLLLCHLIKTVIADGLELLGISAPESM